MRIVGGKFKGRNLAQPKSNAIRPTSDRTRESVFNIISHTAPEKLAGTRVLDVFAGTGALGLEALSRGARFVLFMETGAEGRGVIRSNVEALGLTGCTKVFRRDATRPGEPGTIAPFDLIFADPPYGKGLGEKALTTLHALGWLADDALVILEERKDALPALIDGFTQADVRHFGDTSIGFYRQHHGS